MRRETMDTARIFRNGSSQAVRLPKEYRLPGKDVYVRRLGNVILLIPKKDVWATFMKSLDEFSPDFMEARNQPPVQERKGL